MPVKFGLHKCCSNFWGYSCLIVLGTSVFTWLQGVGTSLLNGTDFTSSFQFSFGTSWKCPSCHLWLQRTQRSGRRLSRPAPTERWARWSCASACKPCCWRRPLPCFRCPTRRFWRWPKRRRCWTRFRPASRPGSEAASSAGTLGLPGPGTSTLTATPDGRSHHCRQTGRRRS